MRQTNPPRRERRVHAIRPATGLSILLLAAAAVADDGALNGVRHRVIVSSDIGGTDPDDIQSMVHLLVYADVFDLEGLVSSPYGPGRKEDILRVIDAYEQDYPHLKSYSATYPEPDALRAVTRQGALDSAGQSGVGQPTEGSEWIVACARREDVRPLHVLVWGGIEDVAQALHDAPDILPRLRVYFIGGPNKKWSVNAYHFVAQNHPKLWMIEANATYRGWFVGGNQEGEWGNRDFVARNVAGHGALGDCFVQAKDTLKMGDSPSVGRLLHGVSGDPSQPGWGGRFVRAWERPHSRFERMTTKEDRTEVFGVLELAIPLDDDGSMHPEAVLAVENQRLPGYAPGDGTMRFRFSPKAAKSYGFRIQSNVPALDGRSGGITADLPSPDVAEHPSDGLPNWWTDDPDPAAAEGAHHGARSVSRHRPDFLHDFAARMDRCRAARSGDSTGVRSPPRRWGTHYLEHPPEWYASAEARAVADSVMQYQSSQGGWPKSTDLAKPPRSPDDIPPEGRGRANSFDNDATTLPMEFLALVADATGVARYRDSFMRGLDYLFAAQYPNGGWPQFYPLRKGYYSRITYNDGAMTRVMTLLRDVAGGRPPYSFVDEQRRAQAAAAVEKGIECMLRTQVRQNGKLTVWCAQHDEKTLEPAPARTYEIPSLSGSESVDIVRFLMGEEDPSPEIIAAVEGAVAWLEAAQISGLRYHRGTAADGERDGWVTPDPEAGPLWARFYDLASNRPVFPGRDGVVHDAFEDLERERRGGYNYYGDWATALLEREYPRWKARHAERLELRPGTPRLES